MTQHKCDLGILGAGPAGLALATGAAQMGAKAVLIEKEKRLGGNSLYSGCIPSKTLIRSAQVYHLTHRFKDFGLPSHRVPPVNFESLVQRIQSVINTIREKDSEEHFSNSGVKVVYGEPKFVDPFTVQVEGEKIQAKNWVIATGSSPSIPSFEGLSAVSFLTSRDLFSLSALPQSMIILGAGPLSVEMAQAFCRLGTKVFIVHRGPQVLSREDKDLADDLMQNLENEGVFFFLNTSVTRIEDREGKKTVLLKIDPKQTKKMLFKIWPDEVVNIDRDQTVTLRAETLLVATGREANLNSLGLDTIGVFFNKEGLKLDHRLRTQHPHIFGAGDVTGKYLFTHAATYEAGIVLNNALLHQPRKADYSLLPWCTYTDPELASIGLNEKRAIEGGIKYSVRIEDFNYNDRFLIQGEKTGKIKTLLDEKEKPIGVQILGPGAGELINEWVAILKGRIKLTTLSRAVHPYPTLGDISKKMAGSFLPDKLLV